MVIKYDFQTFSLQDYGGISRIYAELLKCKQIQSTISILFSNNQYLSETKIRPYSFFKRYNFPYKMQMQYFLNRVYSVSKIKKDNFDIFHPSYYDDYFLEYTGNKPFVVTVHDMIHELFSNEYPDLALDRKITERKKRLVDGASSVIAVSNSTKNDLVNFFQINPDKVEVLYLATKIADYINDDRIISYPYLLFVGRRERYKNFTFFLESISSLIKSHSDLNVVCAGGPPFDSSEICFIRKLGLESKVFHQVVYNDFELYSLYKNALCFCFPSKYEGFGIPVLEAFACGAPAIISNCSSLPEVGGDAALYFNPNDSQSIYENVKKMVFDQDLQSFYRYQGSQRSLLFSWEKFCQQSINVYQKVYLNNCF